MKRFIFQISVSLLLLVALPIGFFFIKQLANLTENEEIVQRVFNKQLETILYTINQNSENVIYSWINQIDLPVDLQSDIIVNIVNHLFENNQAIRQLSFYSVDNLNLLAYYSDDNNRKVDKPNLQLANKLRKFADQKYQRIESVRNNEITNLYFMLKSGNNKILAGFSVLTNTFIEQNLKPGIQQISQDRFNIILVDSLMQTRNINSDTSLVQAYSDHVQELWYFPGVWVKISLQSATISELVSARSKNDNYVLWGLMFVVLIGITFVIVSIRKEIKLAEMKSEFVSNVSHEIRTPLALISMYAETLLLSRVKTEDKKQEYIKVIYHESNRLAGMVNRILSFSKMENSKRNYQFTNVNINELILEVCENFEPHFKSNNVNCTFRLTKNETTVFGDHEAIVESLINLVDNAIKYGKLGDKQLDISTRWDNGILVVAIEDNGIGISLKHQKHIFDKFYRVTQGNLAHKAKGSGLGLNIVQQIMKEHNGKITVRSKDGEGSCFSLFFPPNNQQNG